MNVRLFALYVILASLTSFARMHHIPQYNGTGPKNVYYITGLGDRLFAEDELWGWQDGWAQPFIALRDAYVAQGYNFFTSLPKKIDAAFTKNVFVMFQHNVSFAAWSKQVGSLVDKMVILALEPPHIWGPNYDAAALRYYKKILTWNDTVVDNKQYFKFYFVVPYLSMIEEVVSFKDKKLCTIIQSNKGSSHPNELYSKRREAILFFERHAPHEFDLYGYSWDPKVYKTYKGIVKSKTDTLKKYRFSICYENIAHQKGYITDRIFGSLVAGCVPIYWGSDNITEYVPANCFIDMRRFNTFKDLYQYISTMKEEEYNGYIENIKLFLADTDLRRHSVDFFVETLTRIAHS